MGRFGNLDLISLELPPGEAFIQGRVLETWGDKVLGADDEALIEIAQVLMVDVDFGHWHDGKAIKPGIYVAIHGFGMYPVTFTPPATRFWVGGGGKWSDGAR